MLGFKIKKRQLHTISAVTFGTILGWYQAYSYVCLTPVLAKVFFNFHTDESNLFMAFMVFGIGFLTRPIGGLLFGRWGDLFGRKSAFIGSILIMTVPTFFMGCLPTYTKWGIGAPICLVLLRFIQSIPESGESPGSFCFLYENSGSENKKFMTSWGAFGNQIGAIIGIFEVLILDQFMSKEFLLSWGWRISFWFGGGIGLLGYFLRKTLDETPIFRDLQTLNEIDTERFVKVISNHKKKIMLGTAYGAVNAATFYLFATYLPNYFNLALGLSNRENAIISLSIMVLSTILLPFFGILGDHFQVKKLMIGSTLSIIVLLIPWYYFTTTNNINLVFITAYLYVMPITCITALIPYILVRLFAAPVRFTGVGLAFNLADGIIGGFTPAIAILLAYDSNNQAEFCWFILICAIISLFSYFKIKD